MYSSRSVSEILSSVIWWRDFLEMNPVGQSSLGVWEHMRRVPGGRRMHWLDREQNKLSQASGHSLASISLANLPE